MNGPATRPGATGAVFEGLRTWLGWSGDDETGGGDGGGDGVDRVDTLLVNGLRHALEGIERVDILLVGPGRYCSPLIGCPQTQYMSVHTACRVSRVDDVTSDICRRALLATS